MFNDECLILDFGWKMGGRSWLTARCISVQCISWLRCASACLVAAATYLPKGYLAKPRLRLRLRFAALGSVSARACLTARYQLVALATYLADSVSLILRLGHETRCLYAALPVEAAAADASF